jgi:hypothetical protein
MHRHPIPHPDMVGVVIDRLHELYLRTFSKLPRKPQHVADVKAGKRPATFVKHRCDYWLMYQRGGDLAVVLAAIDELRADVESWRGAEPVGCVVSENVAETKAQGRADHLVLVASQQDTEEALQAAYDAQAMHAHRSRCSRGR